MGLLLHQFQQETQYKILLQNIVRDLHGAKSGVGAECHGAVVACLLVDAAAVVDAGPSFFCSAFFLRGPKPASIALRTVHNTSRNPLIRMAYVLPYL